MPYLVVTKAQFLRTGDSGRKPIAFGLMSRIGQISVTVRARLSSSKGVCTKEEITRGMNWAISLQKDKDYKDKTKRADGHLARMRKKWSGAVHLQNFGNGCDRCTILSHFIDRLVEVLLVPEHCRGCVFDNAHRVASRCITERIADSGLNANISGDASHIKGVDTFVLEYRVQFCFEALCVVHEGAVRIDKKIRPLLNDDVGVFLDKAWWQT